MSLFSSNVKDTVQSLGEAQLLEHIRTWVGPLSPPPPQGIGDDCAVLTLKDPHYKRLATTDGVIYQKHFSAQADPQLVGAKLIKRNLSDIAAMGGIPEQALIVILASNDLKITWLRDFYQGLCDTCQAHHVTLVGGDVASCPQAGFFSAYVTLLGKALNPIPRGQGHAGDTLWVTGSLGGSILGHHLNFVPRLQEGQWLATHPHVHAMLDLSDGLAKDLPALLPPYTQAMLDFNQIPISRCAHTLSAQTGKSALAHALCDGEDHELCFLLDSACCINTFKYNWSQAFAQTPVHCIGSIATSAHKHPGVMNDQDHRPLPSTWKGYEHFYGA